MALFLFRFYPVLLPLLLYLIWYYILRGRALKKGEVPPRFRDGPIFGLLMVSLSIAVLCFLMLGFSIASVDSKGGYEPTHMLSEKQAPAQVKP